MLRKNTSFARVSSRVVDESLAKVEDEPADRTGREITKKVNLAQERATARDRRGQDVYALDCV